MEQNVFQTRLTSIQSNLLSMAYILTSSRDNAYSLLNATTTALQNSQAAQECDTDLKTLAIATMRSIFAARYKGKTIVRDHRARTYSINVAIESENMAATGVTEVSKIQKALESFDEIHRQPYALYVKGYDINEIASRLELPVTTVKARIKYTYDKVRRICSTAC